jgi:hypothetical protein
MEETTPKDITPIKRKGIDIAVSGIKKQYPFVIGYEDDSTSQYDASHYIDLIIDNDKLSEYMDVPIRSNWREFVEDNPQYEKLHSLWSYLNFDDDMLDNIKEHPGYTLMKELTETLETIYQYLPDEYRLFYKSKTTYLDPPPSYPVHLRVNAFIMT